MDRRTGLRDEAPIHYFSLHEERWRSAAQWPPDLDHLGNRPAELPLA